MKTEWQKDIASFKPPEFEKANQKEWIQRRNIQEVTENGETVWESELRFISNDVYEDLMDMKDISEYVIQNVAPMAQYYEGYNAAMILLGQEA